MKNASAATLAILAAGEYVLVELYDITLPTGQVYHFTSSLVPFTAAIYPSGTSNFYQTGLTIQRDTITQQVGVQAGHMQLIVSPQGDSPYAPVLLAGYPLLQALRYGFLDSAYVQMSKLFMNLPVYTNGQYDTSPGAVGWFLGQVQNVDCDRIRATLTLDDSLAFLSTQQMPRNLWQVGCFHQVYDAGCTLLRSAFTSSGTIVTAGDGAHFTTNLTKADHYFELGVITFTSGALSGQSQGISAYLNASGALVTRFPFPTAPSPGDTFTAYPGCDLMQATCTTKFGNLTHFSGQPFIPVPQTMLDGGTDNPPVQTAGRQAGQIIGSQASGAVTVGTYKP